MAAHRIKEGGERSRGGKGEVKRRKSNPVSHLAVAVIYL
jgi:hypothetical protein